MPVQLDWERHAGMDVAGMLLNRSCAPDLGVRENQWCARDFVALRGIAAGEELVSGDAMTGHALAVSLSWFCGSAVCQGGIWPWSDCGEACVSRTRCGPPGVCGLGQRSRHRRRPRWVADR